MNRAAFLLTATVLAVSGPAVPAALTQSGTIPFDSLLVRGNVVIPEDKTTVGGLALLVEFVPAEFSDGISPSTDQILFVLEPSQPPQTPAVEPGIGVSLPGGCLVPHRRGGWSLGDGSVKTCGFEFYHLLPDRTRVDLTALVTDVDALLVQSIATKRWQMKLQVDFAGLDATGIVGPTMIAAAVGNDVGMTSVSSSRESLGGPSEPIPRIALRTALYHIPKVAGRVQSTRQGRWAGRDCPGRIRVRAR